MTCSQSMKAKLNRYFEEIEEIQVLDDILSGYSHVKFDKIYKSKVILSLFELFISDNREEFLSNFTGVQRARYEEELRSIAANFNKQHWEPLNVSNKF